MDRPHINEYFIAMAHIVSSRGTCVRRKVGCILTDKNNFVLSTGYNGRPKGMAHCRDEPCSGANAKSGNDLDKCEAIHAEANALLQCKDAYSIETCYITSFPCIHCLKLLMNTSCRKIVFKDYYIDRANTKILRQKWMNSASGLTIRHNYRVSNIQGQIFRYDGKLWRPYK